MKPNLEQKQITKEINKALTSGFHINTDADEDFLKDSNFNWDDLVKLKEELGTSIIQFIGQVQSVITNVDIINNLGDQKAHFDKVVSLFFSDINEFSHRVKNIRTEHEHLSGHISNINDFNKYNRIAIEYQSMFSDLATLMTPTLSDIMLTVNEVFTKNTSPVIITSESAQDGTN